MATPQSIHPPSPIGIRESGYTSPVRSYTRTSGLVRVHERAVSSYTRTISTFVTTNDLVAADRGFTPVRGHSRRLLVVNLGGDDSLSDLHKAGGNLSQGCSLPTAFATELLPLFVLTSLVLLLKVVPQASCS